MIFPQHSLDNRLVSFWKLEEASGNRLDAYTTVPTVDKSAVNDLAPNATPGNAAGIVGNGLAVVSTSSQSVSIASNSSLQPGGVSFTITGWVKFNTLAGTAERIVTKFAGVIEYAVRVVIGSSQIGLAVLDSTGLHSGNVNASTTISTGNWYFFAAWWDQPNATINCSVNNGTVASTSYGFAVNSGSGAFSLGGTTGFYTNGTIDAVGFWKRILTAEERTYLYRGGSGVEFPFA